MMMKKQLLLLVMMLLPMVASAHDIEVQNDDGVTIYYNYINDGTELEVTFRGSSYREYIGEYTGNVVVPDEVTYMNKTRKVTRIGKYAFYDCLDLTSLAIPNSVTTIGDFAFCNCSDLTPITIPNSVTSIGRFAFGNCSGLTSVTIPNSVTSIGEWAFDHCLGLTSISIPNSVTSIGRYAFAFCFVTSVTIGSGVTSIGGSAFDGYDIPTVISLIENPFTIYDKNSSDRVFSPNTYNNATLYVPKGTIEKYKATKGWKDFVSIVESDASSDVAQIAARPVLVKTDNGFITVEGADERTQISAYTVDGVLVASAVSRNGGAVLNTSLQPGNATIVKIGNKSVKVIMK